MVFLCIRHDVPWDDEEAFRAQLSPAFVPKVEAWNATFRMPFRVFRGEVRTIARENLARVEGIERGSWEDVPEGAIVLPADDDDWWAPDAARVVEAAAVGATEAWHWPHTVLEVPIDPWHRLEILRRRLRPSTPPRWICSTNNYALRRRADREPLFRKHTQMSAWVAGSDAVVGHECGAEACGPGAQRGGIDSFVAVDEGGCRRFATEQSRERGVVGPRPRSEPAFANGGGCRVVHRPQRAP